jgi:8-oxo-dGTP diphosphatase
MPLSGKLDLLAVLTDEYTLVRPDATHFHTTRGYAERTTSRGVVFNEEKLVGLAYIASEDYHKLGGGGANEFEHPLQVLEREILEEFGRHIKVLAKVGRIMEVLHQIEQVQLNMCYIAQVIGEVERKPTPEEIAEGLELRWYAMPEALKVMRKEAKTYKGQHRQKRDLIFLEEAHNRLPSYEHLLQ